VVRYWAEYIKGLNTVIADHSLSDELGVNVVGHLCILLTFRSDMLKVLGV